MMGCEGTGSRGSTSNELNAMFIHYNLVESSVKCPEELTQFSHSYFVYIIYLSPQKTGTHPVSSCRVGLKPPYVWSYDFPAELQQELLYRSCKIEQNAAVSFYHYIHSRTPVTFLGFFFPTYERSAWLTPSTQLHFILLYNSYLANTQ